MVRLKAPQFHPGNSPDKFQFHYGSVKRVLDLDATGAGLNFNSTMVRLKVYSHLIEAVGVAISIPLWFG